MTPASTFFSRMTVITVTIASFAACSKPQFNRSQRSAGAQDEQNAGDVAGKTGNCLNLGGSPNYGNPGQNTGQYPDQGGGKDVIIVPPQGDEPAPPQPTYPCGQPNGQQPRGDVYRPIDQDQNYQPPQYPTQHPVDPNACGKGGIYCDDGANGQWPGQTVGGQPYNHGDVSSCLDAFRRGGYDTQGQWGIDVRTIKNVSVLSNSGISDFSTQPSIVIIKTVSVLGSFHFELVNPNALYCIQSNVSVLEQVLVTSCHGGNVVFGSDVNVLSQVNAQVVDCR